MKILFTGDICFQYQRDVHAGNSAQILSDVLPVMQSADFRVCNLETPIADESVGAPITKTGPNLMGRPENLAFLEAAGCDCAVLANNHTGDYGDDALFSTLSYLDGKHIAHCGAGVNIEEAYRAWRTEKDGVTVSVIAVNENEFGLADVGKAGSAAYSQERLSDAIVRERAVSEFVVIVYHGGNEHNPLPSPMCRERLRMMIRLGADAVIAGHTHCVQGQEIYDGKPIIYSMGNFFFPWKNGNNPWREDLPWQTGYMTMLTLETGKAPTYEIYPYRTSPDGAEIKLFCGEDKEKITAYIDKISGFIHDEDYMRRHYMGWCVVSGLPYIRAMNAKPEYFDPQNPPENISALRNLLMCEAHNELCRATLKLACEGRMAEAYQYEPMTRALQVLPV
ncbi:MAG: CapA family protein [Clostridia bacterium]|nr:CapA family protein [Clostridia bacterium]